MVKRADDLTSVGDHYEDNNGVANSVTDSIDNLNVPTVTWWRHSGLLKLYGMMPILFLGATINGYDGSLLNGLQTMDPWQECK